MRRLLLAVAGLVASAAPLAAEPPGPTALALSPATPAPPGQLRLLPDAAELTPGNAATLWERCLAMFVENPHLLKDLREDHWGNWTATPLDKWPAEEVAGKLRMCRHLLREAEYAARCRDCDWQLHGRPEGIGLLLPDMQGFRMIGTVLAVQARHQVASGDFAGAAHTIRGGLTLGRHLGQKACCLIQVLVGVAITHQMLNQVEAFVQEPGAPNLYWELSAQPRPLFDLYPVAVEDMAMIEKMFPFLSQADGPPWTPAQISAAEDSLKKMAQDFGLRDLEELEIAMRKELRTQVAKEGRKELVKHGYTAEQLAALPDLQVVTLFAGREYRQASAELLRWLQVHDPFDHPGFAKAAKRHTEAMSRLERLFLLHKLLTGLSDGSVADSLRKVAAATQRTDRRVAGLRAVEALRLQAAADGGKLPAQLADVKEVPVPPDPVTGKPFVYTLVDGKATLSAPAPAGQEPSRTNSFAYTLTVRK
jgi:hypothetical protein